jgi:hypothetical protein
MHPVSNNEKTFFLLFSLLVSSHLHVPDFHRKISDELIRVLIRNKALHKYASQPVGLWAATWECWLLEHLSGAELT